MPGGWARQPAVPTAADLRDVLRAHGLDASATLAHLSTALRVGRLTIDAPALDVHASRARAARRRTHTAPAPTPARRPPTPTPPPVHPADPTPGKVGRDSGKTPRRHRPFDPARSAEARARERAAMDELALVQEDAARERQVREAAVRAELARSMAWCEARIAHLDRLRRALEEIEAVGREVSNG